MDAIDEMSVVAKEAIETESKIQDELCINFMDFCVDQTILNFITPAPPRLEAWEDRRDYRFTVEQLKALYEEFVRLEGFRGGDANFPTSMLASTLMSKINYSRNFGG